MKTTKPPRTTTVDTFYDSIEIEDVWKDYEMYIYGDQTEYGENGPDDHLTQFDREAFESFVASLKNVYDVVSFVGFFINLIHFLILTRKELRTNLVYIVMIGICFCDLINFSEHIAQVIMASGLIYKYQCFYKYYHVIMQILGNVSQVMSRRCSGLLGLFIASFRTLSVIFPMSGISRMKTGTGVLIVLLFAIVCGGWSLGYYFQFIIVKANCSGAERPSYVPYYQYVPTEPEMIFRLIDGYIGITVCVLYIFVAAALVFELRRTKKRRKNLKNDKSTSTTMLVIIMAISVFLSEIAYGALFLTNFYIFKDYYEQKYVIGLDVLVYTLVIINSTTHCFICFFMSSQYRDVVKTMICIGKTRKNIMSATPSIQPTSTKTK